MNSATSGSSMVLILAGQSWIQDLNPKNEPMLWFLGKTVPPSSLSQAKKWIIPRSLCSLVSFGAISTFFGTSGTPCLNFFLEGSSRSLKTWSYTVKSLGRIQYQRHWQSFQVVQTPHLWCEIYLLLSSRLLKIIIFKDGSSRKISQNFFLASLAIPEHPSSVSNSRFAYASYKSYTSW